MFQRSATLVPVVRSCCGPCSGPINVQSRNIWDLVRATDPRSVIRSMNREMERMERNIFRNFPVSFALPRIIPIEGSESAGKTFRVNIDVEGYKPEDIKISLKNNVMKIEANMDRKAEDGSRLVQSFVREFNVPSNVDQSSLKSCLHNDGVLSIEAGLLKEDIPKDIPIHHETDATKSKM